MGSWSTYRNSIGFTFQGTDTNHIMWVFPKIMVPPNHSILIGFHFGEKTTPIFGLTPISLSVSYHIMKVWKPFFPKSSWMGVSKNRGKTPKWMVKTMVPNPMNKWDDLGGKNPLFWVQHPNNGPFVHFQGGGSFPPIQVHQGSPQNFRRPGRAVTICLGG